MNPLAAETVAGASGSLFNHSMDWISQAIGAGINRRAQQRQNEWNAQMAAQANQWNIEQWERQNEYNDPSNVVARLEAAGINPALAMGQGASAMISGQMADAIHPANVPQGVNPTPFVAPSFSQSSLISSEVAKNLAEADEAKSRIPVHDSERLLNDQKINESQNMCDKLIAESSLMKQQEFSSFIHTYNELNETAARINNINADTDVKGEQKRLVGQQVNTLMAQGRQLIESAKYYDQLRQNLIEEEKRNSEAFKQKYGGLSPEQVAEKNRKELQLAIDKAEKESKDIDFFEKHRDLMQVLMLINATMEPWLKLTNSMGQLTSVIEKG